jgi:putative ABC transport system permease protein
VPVVAVGFGEAFEGLALDERLPAYGSDAAAWSAVSRDESLVIVGVTFATKGGPIGDAFGPGDTVTVTDPRTGRAVKRTIAATMRSDIGFDGVSARMAYPVLMSEAAVRSQFGAVAALNSAFVRLRDGVDPEDFAARAQASLIAEGVRGTAIEERVRDLFAANVALFRLMQGFLALGLVVGITGLGVVMVRAVRERRRTIGVLRALGFRSRTVRRAFLAESSLIAAEGILSGAALAVLTAWLLFTNSPAFGTITASFPIAWAQVGLIVGVTFVASMLATLAPANRAARIRPALALRISD